MSKRHLIFLFLAIVGILAVAQIPIKNQAQNTQMPIAGRNVNMVAGTDLYVGDIYILL